VLTKHDASIKEEQCSSYNHFAALLNSVGSTNFFSLCKIKKEAISMFSNRVIN